jgi:hypothetical protein
MPVSEQQRSHRSDQIKALRRVTLDSDDRMTQPLRFASPSSIIGGVRQPPAPGPLGLTVPALLSLQQTRGNAAVSRILARQPDSDQSHAPVGSLTPIHRKKGPTAEEKAAAEDAQKRALVQQILADIDQGGGIAVALYPTQAKKEVTDKKTGEKKLVDVVRSAAEFQRQASQFAQDHGAMGMAGGQVKRGMPMALDVSAASLISTLTKGIHDLLAAYPDLVDPIPPVTVKLLAIFTHGEKTGLELAAGGSWVFKSLNAWVTAVAPYMAPGPTIDIYACNTAGTPAKGMPFAESMQQLMQAELEKQYGKDGAGTVGVWGHETARHTTFNKDLRGFVGGESVGLLDTLGSRMVQQAIATEAEGAVGLDDKQMDELNKAGKQAAGRIFEAHGKVGKKKVDYTGAADPRNIYIREIPQRGIDNVWTDLSAESPPTDFSALRLSDKAAERMATGALHFRGLYQAELTKLKAKVAAMAKTKMKVP